MGAYDGNYRSYEFGLIDYGAGGNTLSYIIGPKGKDGLIWDVGVYDVTEAFAGSTTTPNLAVGIVGDQDYNVNEWDMGALSVAGGGKSLRTTYAETDAGWATYMLIPNLTKNVVVMITHVAATGTPTGQAKAFLQVKWAD